MTRACVVIGLAATAGAQVLSEQKISATSGGFTGTLNSGAQFGRSMASLGDFDGDGVGDVAVGALGDGAAGVIWLLYLNEDGTVKDQHEINNVNWAHVDGLPPSIGAAVSSIGDLDGDGVVDLVVGAPGDDWAAIDGGAAHVLFLERDGTLKQSVYISEGSGGFTGDLRAGDEFGRDVSFLSDVDGDGIGDIVVGATFADGIHLFSRTGAVFVLFMNRDGTVRAHVKISEDLGGFTGALDGNDAFGHGCAGIGDLDGDGVPDLAVGARGDDDGGLDAGAVWVVFLRTNGRAKSSIKIGPASGGFHGDVVSPDAFAADVVALGDWDGDGTSELGVSTFADDDGGLNRGSFWILHLYRDGSVRAHKKVSATQGGFGGSLRNGDAFGMGIATLEDLNGDGIPELAVGALGTSDGAFGAGAVWILFMDGLALQSSAEYRNAGTNPESYRAWGNYAGNPVMGGHVDLTVDLSLTGHQRATVLGFMGKATTTLTRGQTVLVDVTHPMGEVLRLPLLAAPVAYRVTIPIDASLCGFTVSTQALHILGVQPFALSSAIDFTICN